MNAKSDRTEYGTLPDEGHAWNEAQKQFLFDTVTRCRRVNGTVPWSEVARVPLLKLRSKNELANKYQNMMRAREDGDRKFYDLNGEQSVQSYIMWSAAEYRVLMEGVQQYTRNNGHVNWQKVCALPILKNRTKLSCTVRRNVLRHRVKGTSPYAQASDNAFIAGSNKRAASTFPPRKDVWTKSESIRL